MQEYTELEVPGYPYIVSNQGDVFSLVGRNRKPRAWRLRLRASRSKSKRYVMVNLISAMGMTERRVGLHRLIAEMFIPNPQGLPEINHKNGIKTDNRAENLEWCTHQENIRHARDSGLMENAKRRTKLNAWQIKEILKCEERQGVLAKRYEVSQSLISKIRRRGQAMSPCQAVTDVL